MWQSGKKPGSFPQEMRFKLQQFLRKALNLWLKHTMHLPPYESEMTFNHNTLLSHSEFSHLSANKCYHTPGCIFSQLLERASGVWVYKFFPWERRVFLGPVGSVRVLPPIWPGQIPLLYPGADISKNHIPRPCSFRGDRCLSFSVFFRLVFY